MIDLEAILRTSRLRLEPIRAAHAPLLFPVLRDARLFRFVPQDPPDSEGALIARYARLERRSSPDGSQTWLNWAIFAGEDSACLGTVQATVNEDATAFLAYELGTAYQGRGYAAEACARVLDLLFSEYGIQTMKALVDTRNEASIRLLERLGFERAGLQVKADRFKGSDSDEYEYRLPATGTKVGTEPGTEPGTAPDSAPRTTRGTASGATPGTAPVSAPGIELCTTPGTTSGTTPAPTPDSAPGTTPGTAPDSAPRTPPG